MSYVSLRVVLVFIQKDLAKLHSVEHLLGNLGVPFDELVNFLTSLTILSIQLGIPSESSCSPLEGHLIKMDILNFDSNQFHHFG